jgi:hypothetical protein
MIILPRQARDKHKEELQTSAVFLQIVPRELWANTATLLTADDGTTAAAAPKVKLPGKAGFAANAMNAARSAVLTSTVVRGCPFCNNGARLY